MFARARGADQIEHGFAHAFFHGARAWVTRVDQLAPAHGAANDAWRCDDRLGIVAAWLLTTLAG
jgi:hypothetical protein